MCAIRFFLFALALTAFGIGSVNATIVNLNAQINLNSSNAVPLNLGVGTYNVTPTNVNEGGLYTAANRFGSVSGCDQSGANCTFGWENSYWIDILNSSQSYGCAANGGVGPLICGAYYATNALAFSNAVATNFTLTAPTTVRFYWLDSDAINNLGGISLRIDQVIDQVPEPSTLALLSLGISLMLWRRHLAKLARAVDTVLSIPRQADSNNVFPALMRV